MFDPTDESAGAIPDGQAPMGTDASDDAALESDSQLDGKAVGGDEDGDGTQGGLDVIKRVLDYGRKKNGIDMGSEQAGNIPAVPAGPGGDKPQDNPFGTRTAPVKFGKRFAEGGPVEDDDLATGAIPDGEEDNRYPEVNAVKGALATQGQADANTAGAIADPEGISDAVSALKSGAQAAGGAISDGVSSLNQEPTTPNPAAPLGDALKQAGGAIQDQVQQFPANAARIMKYLTGDAAHGQEVAAAQQAADPEGKMPPSDRNKAAIQAAVSQGGEEAGWRILQAYRQKYEALRHSAAAVADGGDNAQAAQLATQANTYLPNDTDVHFVSSPNGVTATVTQGDKVISKVPMSTAQFRQYLTSPEGQFDHGMETTPAVALQQAAKQGPAQPSGQEVDFDSKQPSPRGADTRPQGQGKGETPLAQNTLEQAERVAARIFPMVSQSAQRAAYVQKIMGEGGQKYPSEERQATSKQEGALNVAQVRANTSRDNNQNTNQTRRDINDRHYDSYDARTQSIAKQKLADMISKNQNATRGQALNLLGRAISSPGGMDPKQIAQAEKVAGVSIQQLMQQSQQPGVPDTPTGQPAAPASGQAPAGGQTRIINGVTYTKVQGGWKRVQQ